VIGGENSLVQVTAYIARICYCANDECVEPHKIATMPKETINYNG